MAKPQPFRLILASGSVGRRELLQRAGYAFEILAANIDEPSGEQFTDPADHEDLDFFAYPQINTQFGQDSLDAPIDGFMLAKSPKNPDGAKQLLQYLGSGEAADIFLASNPNNVAAMKGADTSKYTALQKKSADIIGSAKHIAQFLDRDTRPDFASTVMIPSLQQFLQTPNDVDNLLKSIEDQKRSIFIG